MSVAIETSTFTDGSLIRTSIINIKGCPNHTSKKCSVKYISGGSVLLPYQLTSFQEMIHQTLRYLSIDITVELSASRKVNLQGTGQKGRAKHHTL